ncbi:MAG: ABC transporter substrate-binding protein, partial [Bdellovibrionota bacterium]
FKIIRDDQTRALKMLNGEIDIAQQEFPPGKIKQLRESENLRVIEIPGLAFTYMLVNFRDPNLRKLELRKALSSLIDRDAIIQHKLDGFATKAVGILTPVNPFFSKELSPPSFDLVFAKKAVADLSGKSKLPKLTIKTSNTPAAV